MAWGSAPQTPNCSLTDSGAASSTSDPPAASASARRRARALRLRPRSALVYVCTMPESTSATTAVSRPMSAYMGSATRPGVRLTLLRTRPGSWGHGPSRSSAHRRCSCAPESCAAATQCALTSDASRTCLATASAMSSKHSTMRCCFGSAHGAKLDAHSAATGFSHSAATGLHCERFTAAATAPAASALAQASTSVLDASACGSSRNVASTTTPSVPSDPMKSLHISYPATFLTVRPPAAMTLPLGRATFMPSTTSRTEP